MPRTWVDRHRAPQPCLLVCGWLATRVCEALWYSVVKEVAWFGQAGGTLCNNGRNTLWFGVERDHPPIYDRRHGELTYSGSMKMEQFEKTCHYDEQSRR